MVRNDLDGLGFIKKTLAEFHDARPVYIACKLFIVLCSNIYPDTPGLLRYMSHGSRSKERLKEARSYLGLPALRAHRLVRHAVRPNA